MAILDGSDTIITARITRLGKQIMATQNERFIVSQFCLGDDEINYNLVDPTDPNYTNIQNLAIFDPSNNGDIEIKSKLIRFSDNLQQIAQNLPVIPNQEYQIVTKVNGTKTFSLENWNNDSVQITFAIQDPIALNFFLSNAFTIDLSEFFINFGVVFNFIPIAPTGSIHGTDQYWFIQNTTITDASDNVLPVVLGIDNQHKPANGSALNSFTNELNIPALSFELKLDSKYVLSTYQYLRKNQLLSITGNIIISNNDASVIPLTNFYGINKNFSNIAVKIPLTIAF